MTTVRRTYLYLLAFAGLAMLSIALANLAQVLIDVALQSPVVRADRYVRDTISLNAAAALVGLPAWFFHWRIADRDRAAVGETGGSATLRRWYLYGLALVGLVTLLAGAQGMIETLWRMATQPPQSALAGLAVGTANTLVGLAVWLTHWVLLPARLTESARRDDGVAVLRSVYLFLALAVGVLGTLGGFSQLLYYAVGRLLGVDHPGGVGGDLLQAAAGP